MEYITIFLFLFLFLVLADLIPLIKKKDKKVLWFSVPVYAAALLVNIMVGLGFRFVSPNDVIMELIGSILKLK
jgi:hypothetical protein